MSNERVADGKNNKNKSSGNLAIDTLGCFRVILYGGSMEDFDRKCRSLVHSGRLLGAPVQLTKFPRTTDHWFWAFWIAGITVRPLDIGSTTCTTIFQLSNGTIICILDRSVGCWVDFIRIWLSSVVWLARLWDVQLFSHKIYPASHLFWAHSAGLLNSYQYRVSEYQNDIFSLNISVKMA